MPALIAAAALTASLALWPQDGGTPRHPQGHRVRVKVSFSEPTVLTGLEVWYGRGVVFRRADVPACPKATLAHGGPAACPKGSIMGRSGGSGPDDEISPKYAFTFVNGPGGRLIPYTVLQRPARVRAPLGARVVQDARGIWPNRDIWTFPAILQSVAGVPIAVDGLRLTFGGQSYAKNYLSTTGCPAGGWAWRVRVRTSDGAVLQTQGRAPCRKKA